MAGVQLSPLAAAVSNAGALGSLPCAMFSADDVRTAWEDFRAASDRPVNLNFFCHAPPDADPAHLDAWRERLAAYYAELGIDAEVGGRRWGGRRSTRR
jgi:nitronate monooxygenase